MQTKTAVSAGGVIFREEDGSFKIAIASREEGKIWCLPKGAVEEGESLKQTAVREVAEETGLLGEVVEKIGQVDYWFYWKPEDTRYHKFVHFYLLKFTEGTIEDHDFEVDEVKWLSFDEAEELLSYRSEREVVRKAKQLLEKIGR